MQSKNLKTLAASLIKAQLDLKNPDKNQQGYGYKYADLSSILDQVKPALAKHGLAIVQTASDDGNGKVGVTTTLLHESGEFIKDTLRLPIPTMKGATATQAAGAAITYARRYAISAILNIAADEDTDASNKNGSPKAPVSHQSEDITETAICKEHNVPMKRVYSQKKKRYYWLHQDENGATCFGNGFLAPQKKA